MNFRKRIALLSTWLWILSPAAAGAEITVSAAASLTNVMRELIADFEASPPGIRVTLNLGPTGALLQQIRNGAPVDVIVAASLADMDRAEKDGLILPETRRNVAGNRLVLAVPRGGPAAISRISDLAAHAVQRIGVGNPATVPAGRYARQVLAAAGLWDRLSDKLVYGESVRQILDYAVRGEVDAAFVYRTDARLAEAGVLVAAVFEDHDPIRYPAAVTASSERPAVARQFVRYLSGEAARRLFDQYGFSAPEE
jgi:molybdate transport system substrate-binding protein